MVRCFIGVFIPEEVKSCVIEIQERLKKLPVHCKFVEKENLHISISFLGEVDENKVLIISEELDKICRNYKKFELTLSKIKLIPNENYIRVIAISVENDLLKEITRSVKESIGGDAKPAHLTLCRVKNIENKKVVVDEMKKYEKESFGSFVVGEMQLIKSELKKPGPVYTTIHESKLLG